MDLIKPNSENCAQIKHKLELDFKLRGILMQIRAYFVISEPPGTKISLKIAILTKLDEIAAKS